MNKDRRKRIRAIADQLAEIAETIHQIGAEERDYIAQLPENMQDGEKGQKAEEVADYIDNAANSLDETISGLESAIEA